MNKDEALDLALEALENLFGIPAQWTGEGGGDVAVWRLGGSHRAQAAITAIKQARALDKKAENARELGLDYEPVAIDGNTSDGYHTFNELYDFRRAYNAALFNEWAAGGKCSVHKSWRHHDGELCFGGGWFIVVAVLPEGQISNHYEAKDWDLFAVLETERALFEFDGHSGSDVVARLKAYTTPPAQPAPVQELPLAVVSRLGFKLALDEGLRQRADKIASALRGGRVNYEVEQDAANLIWEMRDALAASPPAAQRQWVGLTEEQIADFLGDRYRAMTESELEFFRLGEAAHGITKGQT
jgi:hypothetical protein